MPATYTPNIPQPSDNPSTSQPLILNNFTSLDQQFSVDHVGFQVTSNNGMHKQVTFTANQAAPGFGTGVSDIYANLVAGVSELFFQNSRSSTLQLTDLVINTAANAGTAGGTITYIDTPWNLRFLFSVTGIAVGAGGATVIFPAAFATNPPFAMISCQDNVDKRCTYSVLSNAGMTLFGFGTGGVRISWWVVGRMP